MTSTRCASSTSSWRRGLTADMASRLRAGDAPESSPDRHADAREIALAEHVPGHDLARGEDVLGRLAVPHQHARLVVDRHAEVGEGDARAQGIGIAWRRLDGARPMGRGPGE